jgi:hypothetical protein
MAQELNQHRRGFLTLAAKVITASQLGRIISGGSQLSIERDLPSFKGASGWLNSEPLTKTDLHGKVVLVDFWTIRALIGVARFRIFALGRRSTRAMAWWSLASTRQSSTLNEMLIMFAKRLTL